MLGYVGTRLSWKCAVVEVQCLAELRPMLYTLTEARVLCSFRKPLTYRDQLQIWAHQRRIYRKIPDEFPDEKSAIVPNTLWIN